MPQRGEAGEGPLANCSLFWAGAVRRCLCGEGRGAASPTLHRCTAYTAYVRIAAGALPQQP